jgi:hypothetical protein
MISPAIEIMTITAAKTLYTMAMWRKVFSLLHSSCTLASPVTSPFMLSTVPLGSMHTMPWNSENGQKCSGR